MSIQVITHNGQMPKDGGIRLGYCVGCCTVPIGTSVTITPQQLQPQPQQQPKPIEIKTKKPTITAATSGLIFYSNLPRATDDDEECPHCGHYPNNRQDNFVHKSTDLGKSRLVQCSRCSKFLRSYYD